VVAEALVDFFHEPHNREELDDLLSLARPQPFVSQARETEWTGKTIVFTGSLETMSRDEAKAQAERLGARAAGSRSAPRPTWWSRGRAGSKLKKAEELGVRWSTKPRGRGSSLAISRSNGARSASAGRVHAVGHRQRSSPAPSPSATPLIAHCRG
jgi:hypothetical protein